MSGEIKQNKKRKAFAMMKTLLKLWCAPAENRTRGPTMATLDFTTKPLALSLEVGRHEIYNGFTCFEKKSHEQHKNKKIPKLQTINKSILL